MFYYTITIQILYYCITKILYMASIRYYYRSEKPNAFLTLRLMHKFDNETKTDKTGKPVTRTIGANTKLKVSKEFWKQKDKPKAPAEIKNQKSDILKELNSIENYILKSFDRDLDVLTIDKDWLTSELNNYYNPKKVNKEVHFLTYWIDKIINDNEQLLKQGNGKGLKKNTLKGYKDLKNVVIRYKTHNKYLGSSNPTIKSIDAEWFTDFLEWLKLSEDYEHNTAIKKIDILKAVIKTSSIKTEIADDLNKIQAKNNANFKTINTYDNDEDVIYLKEEELNRIKELKLESKALDNARKWLLIACYSGQRGEALTTRIKKENFIDDGNGNIRIEIKQIKVNNKITIPVLPFIKEMYLKDELPYKISTQKMNKYIKEVCKKAEINEMVVGKIRDSKTNRNIKKARPKYEYIRTHTGRRTFATLHYGKLNNKDIMKVTGHKTYSSFMKYIAKDEDDHIDTFNEFYKLKEEKENAKKEPVLKVVKKASNQN